MTHALAALALLVGMCASPAHARPPGHRGPPPPMGPMLHALQDLELDADQQSQLEEVLATMEAERPEPPARGERPERPSEAEREARHAERKAHAEALEAQLALPTPDRELLHEQLDAGPHGDAPQVVHDHFDLLLGVHASLSGDQRTELVDTLAEGRARRGERCEGKRGGPRGE